MKFLRVLLLGLMLIVLPRAAGAQEDDARAQSYAALQAQDVRLALIADRMLQANAQLCRNTMPLTGMILHSSDQYSAPLDGWFADGSVAILSIVPGSAAEAAGLMPDDGIIGLDGVPFSALAMVDGEPRRDTIFDLISQRDSTSPPRFSYRRAGEQQSVELDAPQGCRALVEVLADNDRVARSNGRVIQISYGMATILDDDQLAVVFAHELAHSVLEHRRRLSDAGVDGGFFGEFGRNRRLGREVEAEADLLSVHLLANAGFDPAIAPHFWRSDVSRSLGGGLLRSRRYHSPERRAEMMEREIAAYREGPDGLSMAPHLLSRRDLPFAD